MRWCVLSVGYCMCVYVQGLQALIGACFTGEDAVKAGLLLGKETQQLHICFNASGISVTDEKGVVTRHGALLGWSSGAQVFGFVNGTSCDTGVLRNDNIQRAALVRVGCCSQTAIYITNLGEGDATPGHALEATHVLWQPSVVEEWDEWVSRGLSWLSCRSQCQRLQAPMHPCIGPCM